MRKTLTHLLSVIVCTLSLMSCSSLSGTNSNNAIDQFKTPDDIQSMLRKGDEALSRGAYDDAQVQYALAVKEQPGNVELLYKLAIVHYEKGTHDVAQGLLTRIADQDSTNSGAYELLGLIALKSENLDVAENHLLKALEINGVRWRSLNAMGILKDLQSHHDDAQAYYQKAGLLGPSKAQIENNLGYSYYLQGRDALAMQHFKKATQLDSGYDKAWANLGLAFVRQKQYEEARFAFAKVVDESTVANNLGYLAMLQRDFKTATRELSNAIQLAPSHYPKANENLRMVQQRKENLLAEAVEPARVEPARIVEIPASYRPEMGGKKKLSAVVADRNTASVSQTSDDTVRFAQIRLNEFGYGINRPDGILGADTRHALRLFQSDNGLAVSGRLSQQTQKALRIR